MPVCAGSVRRERNRPGCDLTAPPPGL